MKQNTTDNIFGFLSGLLLIICIALLMEEAGATGNEPDPKTQQEQAQSQGQYQEQGQGQDQSQQAHATGGNSEATGGNASASNDGVTVDAGDSHTENNSSNVVLVPNNNTESCVRVWGIAFGKNGESGALGIPWRSAKCDYEQAADDAFAAGERDLGWFWKCQNKNLYKRFKEEGDTDNQAIEDCHMRMLATTSTNEVVADLEERLRAAENLIELQRSHKAVCEESLDRCEKTAYGSK